MPARFQAGIIYFIWLEDDVRSQLQHTWIIDAVHLPHDIARRIGINSAKLRMVKNIERINIQPHANTVTMDRCAFYQRQVHIGASRQAEGITGSSVIRRSRRVAES